MKVIKQENHARLSRLVLNDLIRIKLESVNVEEYASADAINLWYQDGVRRPNYRRASADNDEEDLGSELDDFVCDDEDGMTLYLSMSSGRVIQL